MPVSIKEVIRGSVACRYNLRPGDTILKINDQDINDFIDLQFYTTDNLLEIELLDQENIRRIVRIEDFWEGKLGIEPETYQIKKCLNNCIFCFIDQMPPNLRDPLYVKDDDYLFSFVFGNYISLNNITPNEFQRIAKQRISPLYISVHTTDIKLRAEVMGYRRKFDIIETLTCLSDNGISFHTQIVLIPAYNDGEQLVKTINDLSSPRLNTLSIGIVPVGLTTHRDGLDELYGFNTSSAKSVINTVNSLTGQKGLNNVYIADELYLLAGEEIPGVDYYNDFCQIENGIGMVRATRDNFARNKKSFSKTLDNQSAVFITGKLTYELIKEFSEQINATDKKTYSSVIAVKNNFFGESVTVSGLLTYQDIKAQLKNVENLPQVLIFSSNMFNTDGYTIDNVHYDDFPKLFNRKVLIVDELWNEWFFVS